MVLNNPLFVARNSRSASYQIEQSLRIAKQSYLYYTPSSNGNRTTWTYSCWVKRGTNNQAIDTILHANANYGNDWTSDSLQFHTSNFGIQIYCIRSQTNNSVAYTTEKYRDHSAWYHIVAVWDSNNGTATDRFRYYINGVRQTFNWSTTPGSGFTSLINNSSYVHRIGQGASQNSEKYMAECHFVEGTAVTDALDFGEYDNNGVWRPIEYTGSYGSGGFYLKFDPSATNGVGHDHSGNGNHWSTQNIVTTGTETDVMSDTPTNNFATLNPLEPASASDGTLSQGNLYIANQDYSLHKATFRFGGGGPTSGKYYWEVTHTGGNYTSYIGVTANLTQDAGEIAGGGDKSWFGNNTSRKYDNTTQSYTGSYSSGDVHGYAIDLDAQEIKYYVNGVLKLTDTTLPDPATTVLVPFQFTTNSGSGYSWTNTNWNFGQRDFSHQPTGYKSLCTSNLPTPTIKDGSKYFNSVIYAPDGSSSFAVTGVGFQPDLVWVKSRVYAEDHQLNDAVRGATKGLQSNLNNAETTQTNGLTSFDSDGFTVGNLSDYNYNGDSIISWNWKANGSGSSNTDGSITSTVSANPTAGFSIVSYTGTGANATVGHGLGVQPSFYVVKPRSEANNWPCWHKDLTNDGYYIHLNFSLKQDLATAVWNNTAPSSTVFNIGTNTNVNQQDATFIAYVFAEVEGYSRISYWSGNGNADGPFVHCGFRPAVLLLKNYRGGSETDWIIQDSTRSTYNVVDDILRPNTNQSEASGNSNYYVDFLSNGFKIRTSSAAWNESGSDYLFLAFAENPFGGSGVSPATAR